MDFISIDKIKANPKNPRVIKDERFKKLVQSLQEFPEMLEKRPLVCVTDVDGKLFPLGGNMRLKAANELKMKELPVIMADDWTEEQRQEFIIKDNVGFGEWNWGELQTDFDLLQLEEWGLEVPGFDVNGENLGEEFTLPDGDKAPFQQMTFTLADAQATVIKNAIDDIKGTDEYKYAETMGNENSNGNALYLIVASWAGQRK
jgi:hypothetical protein